MTEFPRTTVGGVSQRTTWSAQVVSMEQFITHVAAHTEHTHLLQPNSTALNQLARALKDKMRIPGVRAVPSVGTAVRGSA